MRSFLRNNGLSVALLLLFALTMLGQTLAGHRAYNEEQRQHHEPTVGLLEYLGTGHFWEATGENWESEFLQMAMFVVLTISLFQRGSAESKDPDDPGEPVNADPRRSRNNPDAPGPVRRGGWQLWLYSHSLSITFALLFFVSLAMHALGGLKEQNDERRQHGEAAMTMVQYVGSARFWFESFQNWQSEFLSLAAMVVGTIYLRQRGSAESKPVHAPHADTGR
jgi:hypothetical protein